MVTHELKMAVDPVDANTAAIVEQMAEASARDGMVALVETAAGEKLLVGYSGRFSLERPLRLHSSADSTGTEKTDIPLRIITLRSVDSAPSMGCTAEML